MVDDKATILELLSGSLRFAGFEVVTAASGTVARRAQRLGLIRDGHLEIRPAARPAWARTGGP